MQYGGGRHVADLRELREDKTLQKATGLKAIPSDSGTGDWILRSGKGEGIEGMGKVHTETDILMLKMDTNEEYTLWADPTIIDLGDKDYAEKLYTGQEVDRPILVGLKELPIFVHYEYRKGNAMYFSIGVLTYNLMVAQKYFVIQEGMEHCTIATLRWKLVQIGAWIFGHSNRIRLKIATTVEKFNHYMRMLKRMEAIAALPC